MKIIIDLMRPKIYFNITLILNPNPDPTLRISGSGTNVTVLQASGEHKQKINIQIAVDGLKMRDDKTGVCRSFSVQGTVTTVHLNFERLTPSAPEYRY